MSEAYKPFEFHIGDKDFALELGMCAVALFRKQQEVAYIAVDLEQEGEEVTMRIFNNPEIAHWLAGYELVEKDGNYYRVVKRMPYEGISQTFREVHGWNPAIIEREEPNEREIDMWVDVNTKDLDEA